MGTETTAGQIAVGQEYRTQDSLWTPAVEVKVLSHRVTIEHGDGTFRVLHPTAKVLVR
jgi:hypothetical protein